MAITRNRSTFIGNTTDLASLPDHTKPGTYFWDTQAKELYIKSTDDKWYSVNRYENGETEAKYHYHVGV